MNWSFRIVTVLLVLALAAGPPVRTRGQTRSRIALLLGAVAFLALAKGASYALLPALVLLIPPSAWAAGAGRRRSSPRSSP